MLGCGSRSGALRQAFSPAHANTTTNMDTNAYSVFYSDTCTIGYADHNAITHTIGKAIPFTYSFTHNVTVAIDNACPVSFTYTVSDYNRDRYGNPLLHPDTTTKRSEPKGDL